MPQRGISIILIKDHGNLYQIIKETSTESIPQFATDPAWLESSLDSYKADAGIW